MAKAGKRYIAARKAFDARSAHVVGLDEAVKLVKENAKAKFDETIELALNLGVDPRHADQMVRGVVSLPNGTGKTVRVGVFAKGAKADEAKDAGADVVGAEDLMETVQGGTVDFDVCIATPDMMPVVGRLGKVEKAGVIHVGVGKASFDEAKIAENVKTLVDAVQKAKPSGAKGAYMKKISISSTMGPGVSVDIASFAT